MSAGMIMELKPQISLPLFLPLLQESSLSSPLSAWEHGCRERRDAGRLSVLSVEMFKVSPHAGDVCPHGALTVRSSPNGRERARTPAVGLWRCISLGCAIRGALSQQLPSQHQGQGALL